MSFRQRVKAMLGYASLTQPTRAKVANLPDMQGSGAVRNLCEVANDGEWRVAA